MEGTAATAWADLSEFVKLTGCPISVAFLVWMLWKAYGPSGYLWKDKGKKK